MAALMLLLPIEAMTEEKTNTWTDRSHPMYRHWAQIIQENLDLCIKTRDNQTRQRRGDRKILNGKGYCHAVSNEFQVFDVTCIALLVKQETFSI